jgi:hypothetical protein
VDEAAEAVSAVDVAVGRRLELCWLGLGTCESAVWALAVVVPDVGVQDVFEVVAAEDQEPVETLVADSADESLGVGRSPAALAPACGSP